MEETALPQSLDLQVGEARFVFEVKTIQRMELLVLQHDSISEIYFDQTILYSIRACFLKFMWIEQRASNLGPGGYSLGRACEPTRAPF